MIDITYIAHCGNNINFSINWLGNEAFKSQGLDVHYSIRNASDYDSIDHYKPLIYDRSDLYISAMRQAN